MSQLQIVNGEFYAITDTVHMLELAWQTAKLTEKTSSVDGTQHLLNAKSGKLAKFPAKIEDLKSYKVTVENGDVFVEV